MTFQKTNLPILEKSAIYIVITISISEPKNSRHDLSKKETT